MGIWREEKVNIDAYDSFRKGRERGSRKGRNDDSKFDAKFYCGSSVLKRQYVSLSQAQMNSLDSLIYSRFDPSHFPLLSRVVISAVNLFLTICRHLAGCYVQLRCASLWKCWRTLHLAAPSMLTCKHFLSYKHFSQKTYTLIPALGTCAWNSPSSD